MTKQTFNTRLIATGAILTAIVIVLQYVGSFIRFGPFSISLVLIPIVLGAAVCNKYISSWLGFVFGIVVLLSGDAAAFFAVNAIGTIITVLLKGAACGFAAGLVYELIEKKNRYVATILAAITCPVVNTGVFLVGCRVFFFDTVREWAGGGNVFVYMIVGLVGVNFLLELAANVVLSPTIVRIIDVVKKKK